MIDSLIEAVNRGGDSAECGERERAAIEARLQQPVRDLDSSSNRPCARVVGYGLTAMFIPTAFDLTFSFTPTGSNQTFTETDTAAKPNQHGNVVICHLDKAKNTFTGLEGTASLSGDVTGFFTPARREEKSCRGAQGLRVTLTMKVAVLVLPLVSVAEQVTRVRPTANRRPDRGEQVTGTTPSTSSCAVTV
jgi:hypothetical protein